MRVGWYWSRRKRAISRACPRSLAARRQLGIAPAVRGQRAGVRYISSVIGSGLDRHSQSRPRFDYSIAHSRQRSPDDSAPWPHLVPCPSLASDAGLFTLTLDYTIIVSPLVQRADSHKFEMLSPGRPAYLHIPRREVLAPLRAFSGRLVHLIRCSRVSRLHRFSRVPSSAGGKGLAIAVLARGAD